MKKEYWELVKKFEGIDNINIPARERTLIMKQLGIPHTQLFFFDTKGSHSVEKWKIAGFYGSEIDKFHTSLAIETRDGLKKRVLAVYFSAMQKKGFKRNTSEREGWKH